MIINTIKVLLAGLVLFTMLALLDSCNDSAALDANGVPGKLMVGVYTGGDNPLGVKEVSAKIGEYFSKKLDMKVGFVYVSDYTAVIEAIRAKKIHVAYMSPFSYVLASQTHDITPIVTMGENGKQHLYHSVIFTNNFTNINNIDDLKAKSKSLTLCFADPASTSGHLIPRAYLTTIGLNPDSSFKQVIFAGSHPASILAVASGKINIGCTAKEYGLDLLIKHGLVKPSQIKVLWQSDPIVSSPIVARNDLNKNFIKKIQNLYLNMATDNPKLFWAYVKLYYTKGGNLSYMPIQDSMYNGLRKIAGGIKDINAGN